MDSAKVDDLAMVPALAVVRECCDVVLDVGDQPGRRLDQARQAGIAAVQGGDIRGELLGPGQRFTGVAVPEPPLDPLQPVLQGGCFDGTVVSQALRVLTKYGQPHGDVEPVQHMLAAGRQIAH